jgi:hypothetical protein
MLVFRSPEKAGKTGYCLANILWENLINEVAVSILEVRIRIVLGDPDIPVLEMVRIMQKTRFTA